MKLENSRILVTGAAGGIGSATAACLAAAGAKLLLTDVRAEALRRTVEDLRAQTLHPTAGGARGGVHADVVAVAADVMTPEGRAALAADARESGVNVLINVAGVNPFGPLADQSPAEVEKTLLINALAPMLLCQALLPVLARSEQAHIVNVGSAFGSIGFPCFCAYSASKFAVRGFSEALRRELADTQIRVHYVAPRATRTALSTDRLRAMNEALGIAMDSPETVARAIVRALRKRRREVHVGLAERLAAKVNALFPGLVDNALRKQLPTVRRYATSVDSAAPRAAAQPSIGLQA